MLTLKSRRQKLSDLAKYFSVFLKVTITLDHKIGFQLHIMILTSEKYPESIFKLMFSDFLQRIPGKMVTQVENLNEPIHCNGSNLNASEPFATAQDSVKLSCCSLKRRVAIGLTGGKS